MAEQSTTLSAKQVATKLGTDPKTFRRFLRSNACSVEPVGQGGRYEFRVKDVGALKNQFVAWRKPGPVTRKPITETHTEKELAPAKRETKRRKHKIDDDPLEVRLSSTIAQRQQGAAMANAIEAEMDEEPTDEELADLALEQLAELDIEAMLNAD